MNKTIPFWCVVGLLLTMFVQCTNESNDGAGRKIPGFNGKRREPDLPPSVRPGSRPTRPATTSNPSRADRPRQTNLPPTHRIVDPQEYLKRLEKMRINIARQELAIVERKHPAQRRVILKTVLTDTTSPLLREAAIVYLRKDRTALSDREILDLAGNDPSSSIRRYASQEIVARHLWDGIPVLIASMRHTSPLIRKQAIEAFEKLFGVKTGFEYAASAENREIHVRQIEQTYPKFKKFFDLAGKYKEHERRAVEAQLRRKSGMQ